MDAPRELEREEKIEGAKGLFCHGLTSCTSAASHHDWPQLNDQDDPSVKSSELGHSNRTAFCM